MDTAEFPILGWPTDLYREHIGTREVCYCGLNDIDIEHASYAVMGEACCTKRCYNEALAASDACGGFHGG